MKSSLNKLMMMIGGLLVVLALVLLNAGAFNHSVRDEVSRDMLQGSVVVYTTLAVLVFVIGANWRKRGKETLVLLSSILAMLVIVEAVLRVFQLFPDKTMERAYTFHSPRYHHELPPNKTMCDGIADGNAIIVQTNEDGFRTAYERKTFLEHKERIAILGDSFTFGNGVRQERTFSEVMEHLLRDALPSKNVGVLNAGVTSYSPFLERVTYAGKVRAYKPTIVLLVLDVTDIGDDIIYMRKAKQNGDSITFDVQSTQPPYYGALHQLITPFLRFPLQKIIQRIHPDDVRSTKRKAFETVDVEVDGVMERSRFFILRHSLDVTRQYFQRTLDNINRLAREVQRDSAQFVLVITPRYQHWNAKECPKDWKRSEYGINESFQFEYFKFFDEKKDSIEYPCFNMLPAFQATNEFPLVFEQDAHWNERGHAFVGRVLTEYLLHDRLVK